MGSSELRWRVLVAVIAGAVLLGSSGSAFASNWTNSSGSNAAFGWTGGFNNTDLFGNPTVTTAGFFFKPTTFSATGGAGLGDSATDFARVTVDRALSNPAGGPAIHEIRVQEFGTWTSDISQASDFTVQADFAVFRQSPTPLGTTGSLGMAVTFFPDGTWTAERTLTAGGADPPFSNLDWNKFQITVTNTIQVSSAAPAGSTIEKTGMRIIVPEPTSILFLLAGFGPFVLRRSSR